MVTTNNAREVLNAVRGKDSAGRMEAVRAVSDLLHSYTSPEDFDRSLDVVRQAQSLEDLPEKRRAFNDTYLETIEALLDTFRNLKQ